MKIITLFACLLLSSSLFSQGSLYMPVEFQKAYANNTRSLSGIPSKDYWQNHSAYTIDAEIEPSTWKINGHEQIIYSNNSPDTLFSLVIKTYPNHYKKGMPRANEVPLETLTDGMKITECIINNISIDMENNPYVRFYGTYFQIKLLNPILPKDTATLQLTWSSEIPSIYVNRIGAYDKNSAFVGYWYPQIARYDDIDGWDRIEYLGTQEFNTDFADFNVKIKVQKGYTIWATGVLQNPVDVFSTEELAIYQKALTSPEPVTIMEGNNTPTMIEGEEEWHYKAAHVKDFAFGVSNTFKWISNSVNVKGKEVLSSLVYDVNENETAERLLEVQEKSLRYLSTVSPGISYPYPCFTTFLGVTEFDGMEFPMLANNGVSTKGYQNTDVTFHELAHSYFPFYIGINEVKHSWMEEGWAIFFTIKFMQSYYAGRADENAELNRNLISYNRSAGAMWDVPLITPSYLLATKPAHAHLSYRKPAFMYLTLEDMLGEEMFLKCLQTYMNRWAGKHPTPYDFMYTFNEISNQNLDWFWNAWVFMPGYGDLALTEVNLEKGEVNVQNMGGLPLPIILKISYGNGTEKIIEKTAEIWTSGDRTVAIGLEDVNNIRSINLITSHYPDSDKTNNSLDIK